MKINISKTKEIISKSTKVVGWYLHKYDSSKGGDATIRGPWNRWVTVFNGNDLEGKYVSDVQDDAEYICEAMNNYPTAINEIEKLKRALEIAVTRLKYYENTSQIDLRRHDVEALGYDNLRSGRGARQALKEIEEVLKND